ncbi:MAG: flagellar hook-basal body complex protein [Pseudomonadota bacterium]|nr:flagellar hook-basal body complex protein [Pseudomonadota bacterium]
MSIYGALFAGVSGIDAQSNSLGIISNNISNANTIGYKQAESEFQTLVTGVSSSSSSFAPGGVLAGNRQLIDQQGLLQSTNSPTDVAIQGSGMFVVNQTSNGSGQVLYSRAGSFTQDANGNFVNSAGYFLQAWPLDSNGDLPGAPGNTTNTTSSANLSSLQTVNVQNVTGTATPTSSVSLSANLNAGQTASLGAGATASMDLNDTANFGITANTLIVPTAVDHLTRGDKFSIATDLTGVNASFTYGGFTVGRDITTGASGDAGTTLASGPATLNNTPIVPTAITTNAASSARIDVTVASTANLRTGDYVTLAGIAAFDNFTAPDLNETAQIVVDDATHFHYTAAITSGSGNTASAGGVSDGGALGTATPDPFATTNTSHTVTVTQIGHGLVAGDVVTFSGITAAVDGIPASELNSSFVVQSIVDADHYTISTPTTAATSTGGGGSGTILATTRPFAGNILDASTDTQTFLGITGTSGFLNSALSFTINTAASGTVTFTYTPSAPNPLLGQFNSLTNLVSAINDVSGLTARIVNNQLFVGPSDANASITFANGAAAGSSGPPVKAGINWINELGLASSVTGNNPTLSGTHRFSTLQSLADNINTVTGLSATVANPTGTASVAIDVANPLDTIDFTDNTYGGGGGQNTGSPLAALGLTGIASFNNVVPSGAVRTTGTLGPAYEPTSSGKNMASGAISPQFSRPVTIYDALGAAHNLNMAFLKTGANTWAVEVYSQPGTDVATSLDGTNDGLVATGTLTFNGDGTLHNVSSGLTVPVSVDWTNNALPSSINFDWGTIDKTNGLSQFDSGYNVNSVSQNGTPVGQLTGVSIDSNGFITASFNNGQTQRLYKIPLAQFTDADQLESVTGNAYLQTSGSGIVNLKQAGQSGVGSISSSSLEQSNVELADQLTQMIVAQRSYEANTKVISTANTLLNDLDQIIQG